MIAGPALRACRPSIFSMFSAASADREAPDDSPPRAPVSTVGVPPQCPIERGSAGGADLPFGVLFRTLIMFFLVGINVSKGTRICSASCERARLFGGFHGFNTYPHQSTRAVLNFVRSAPTMFANYTGASGRHCDCAKVGTQRLHRGFPQSNISLLVSSRSPPQRRRKKEPAMRKTIPGISRLRGPLGSCPLRYPDPAMRLCFSESLNWSAFLAEMV